MIAYVIPSLPSWARPLYTELLSYIYLWAHIILVTGKKYTHTYVRKQRCDTVSSGGGGGVVDITSSSSSDNKPTLLFCFNSLEKSTATSTLTHWYILLLTYRPSIKKNTEIPAYVLYIRRTLYARTQTHKRAAARKNRRRGRGAGRSVENGNKNKHGCREYYK